MTHRHPPATGLPTTLITPAAIEWSDEQPVSTAFGDVYYSRDDGLAESRHVFMAGNELPVRWTNLAAGGSFTIIETGFGSGLNFLAAVDLWLALTPDDCRLHYVSLEKFPLRSADLRRALANWPTLASLADQLADHYPPPVPGFHRRWLYRDRVCLTLVFDDAVAGLDDLAASDHPAFQHSANPMADAWFLDGFAPAKNPDLWRPELFARMVRLSGPGTTASTFTVARQVRDGLAAAGFAVGKTVGFGRKREMLRALFQGVTAPLAANATMQTGSPLRNSPHQPPWYLPPARHSGNRHAVVIGSGIAGCASAAALARRNWRVTLVDREPHIAAGASGNPQGILYPRLSVEDQALSRFARTALCHALAFYQPFWARAGHGERCGVLVLPESDRERGQFLQIAERYRGAPGLVSLMTSEQLAAIAGVDLEAPLGLFYPGLGWVAPPSVCSTLAEGCELIQGDVGELHYDSEDQQWHIMDIHGATLLSAPVVILANAAEAAQFTQTNHLPLRQIRGQISTFPASEQSRKLNTAICGAGYLAPAHTGVHSLGATYDLDDRDVRTRSEDHYRNLATLAATDQALGKLFTPPALGGRAALRCTTPDYLPVAGPAPHFPSFVDDYQALSRNARADIPLAGTCWPGLWLNCGHGSRGLTYAPLTAELIASLISGEPSPLPSDLVTALHPGRFIIRDLKRNRLASASDRTLLTK